MEIGEYFIDSLNVYDPIRKYEKHLNSINITDNVGVNEKFLAVIYLQGYQNYGK